jgi:hypothetical protein
MLSRITQSPYLNLLSGMILLSASLYEIVVTTDEAAFGIRHGILIFSIIQIVKTIPEIMHGLTEIQEAGKVMQQKSGRLANQESN